jgi:hypothetical protein
MKKKEKAYIYTRVGIILFAVGLWITLVVRASV